MQNIHFIENKNSWENVKLYLMNKYLYNFEYLQKKTTFL